MMVDLPRRTPETHFWCLNDSVRWTFVAGCPRHLQPIHMGVPSCCRRAWSVPLPGLVPLHLRPFPSSCRLSEPPHSVRPSHPDSGKATIDDKAATPNSSSDTRCPWQFLRPRTRDSELRISNPGQRRLGQGTFLLPGVSSCNIVISHAPLSTKTPRKVKDTHARTSTNQNMPASLDSSRPIMAPSVRLNPTHLITLNPPTPSPPQAHIQLIA